MNGTVSEDSLLCFIVIITVILTGIFRNFDGKSIVKGMLSLAVVSQGRNVRAEPTLGLVFPPKPTLVYLFFFFL